MSCLVNQTFKFLQYPVFFGNTRVIEKVYDFAPRWGFSTNITVLWLGTQEEAKQYLYGVVGCSLAICIFILLWFMAILGCKCAGPKRVGLFSGRRKPRKPKSIPPVVKDTLDPEDGDDVLNNNQNSENYLASEENCMNPEGDKDGEGARDSSNVSANIPVQDEQKWRLNAEDDDDYGEVDPPNKLAESFHDDKGSLHEDNLRLTAALDALSESFIVSWRQERRLRRARIAVLLCSFGITVSVILMLTVGIDMLIKASTDAVSGLDQAQNLTNESINLIDEFLVRQAMVSNATRSFVDSVNGFCPNIIDQICRNLTSEPPECNFTGIPYAMELQTIVGSLSNNILKSANSTRDDLVTFSDVLGSARAKAATFNWAFIVATVFSLLLLFLNWLVAYGVIIAWRKQSRISCLRKILNVLRHWLLVPTFFFLVVMSWIFSMIFVIGSIMSTDMCVNSPDNRVVSLLQEQGSFIGSTALQLLIFYIEGCPWNSIPYEFIDQLNNTLVVASNVAAFARNISNVTVNNFEQTCGTDPTLIHAFAIALEGVACILAGTLVDIQLYFACDNWRPLYCTVVYDAFCYSGNQAFYYICITQIFIVIFSMVMLTLRVAFYMPEDVYYDESGKRHSDEEVTAELLTSPVEARDQGEASQEPEQFASHGIPLTTEGERNSQVDVPGKAENRTSPVVGLD